jgi:catechol 2,3-dioxygenase-like lactoylglutathione lyase family enzyme
MSPSLTSVHHVAIFVHALAPCEHFYGEVLGLPIVRRWTNVEGNDTRSVWFGLGHGAFLAVELNPQPQPTNNRRTTCDGWHLLAIGIDKNEREI